MASARNRRTCRLADTSYGPQVPGGHYLDDYWRHEYIVDAMYSTVRGQQVWIVARWLPTTIDSHPNASWQWKDDQEHTTVHCTRWDPKDIIISQPAK